MISNALSGGGVAAAAFTDNGRRLAVVESDGARSQGTIVDTATGKVTPFVADPLATSRPALAWSHDGAWLFVATSTAAVDAVDRRGRAFAVSIPAVEGAGVLAR